MKSPKTILRELHLIEAMLDPDHPTHGFSRADQVVMVGAAAAIRWVLEPRAKPVSRQVQPVRRRFRRAAH